MKIAPILGYNPMERSFLIEIYQTPDFLSTAEDYSAAHPQEPIYSTNCHFNRKNFRYISKVT
jgi:hypothetical protein